MSVHIIRRVLAGMAVTAVMLGLAACADSVSSGSAAPSASSSPSLAPGADSLQADYVQTVRAVLPSVVLIRTSRDLGSGIVFDTNGDIVTNDHVVGSATSFQVTPSGSATSLQATLVGTYPPDDLAVIRVSDPSRAQAGHVRRFQHRSGR